MPLNITEATKVVNKNFNRIHLCSEHLRRTNLYVYTHEKNLYNKIISIYEAKKRQQCQTQKPQIEHFVDTT